MNLVDSARTRWGAFEQANGRTRNARALQIPLEGIFRFVGPVMKATGAADRRNARFAQNLKELLERCRDDEGAGPAWYGSIEVLLL
jgi:hypothetical protein